MKIVRFVYYLIYVSSVEKPWSDEELSELVTASRKANFKSDITGLLIYQQKCFIHLIEGEEELVKKLFNNICADPRHFGLIILMDGEITHRNFSGMALDFRHAAQGKVFAESELSKDQYGILKTLNDFVTHIR